ncbi:hypothetical protein Bsub01_04018 [Bacillus subtilis]|nr:hypothetical protein BSR08_17735 [Bacillus subtilis]AYK59127.1 hypothetical protein D9C10_19330 [Bacillus subtilis subsp. subtilis]BAO93655.1 hypothetical protein BSNT_10683 [Bacillus subtilis subsp. natto BEST195]GAK78108.1 hypothetical protein BSMD_000030 [Bacillus subtilis Miyagi-4]ARI86616.1 hypothetical protein B7470_10950 [Bacillus subtilis]
MSQNKLLFLLFLFSSIVRLFFNTVLSPTVSWKSWTVNIVFILLFLLFLNLTLKERKSKDQVL